MKKDYGFNFTAMKAENALEQVVKTLCEMVDDVRATRSGGTRMDLKIVRGATGIVFHKKGLFDDDPHFSIELKEGHSILPREASLPMLRHLYLELSHVLKHA
jgi:hypothetical protein